MVNFCLFDNILSLLGITKPIKNIDDDNYV